MMISSCLLLHFQEAATEGVLYKENLADFYSQKIKLNSAVIPPLVSKDTFPDQYNTFTSFIFKD